MPPRITRRTFLQGSAAGAVIVVTASACGSSGEGSSSSSTLPVGTPDDPVTLPTFDGITAVATDAEVETGTLRILNYSDYINPDVIARFEEQFGVTVEVTGFDTEDQALAKAQQGAVKADLLMGITYTTLPRFAAGKLLQPLNPALIPYSSNVAEALQDPFYDVGGVYTRPYTFYKTGIGYRPAEVDPAVFEAGETGWAALWDEQFKGYVAILDDKREAIAMALLYRGNDDVNTSDQAALDQAVADLDALVAATNARVDAYVYQKLGENAFHIAQAWSGDVLLGLQYLPEGEGPEELAFWHPEVTTVGNDLMAVMADAEKPVLAHKFIDFLLQPTNAQDNFAYVGYQPAVIEPTGQDLIAAELVPSNLENSLVTPTDFNNGLRQYALQGKTETQWEDAWAEFTAG